MLDRRAMFRFTVDISIGAHWRRAIIAIVDPLGLSSLCERDERLAVRVSEGGGVPRRVDVVR